MPTRDVKSVDQYIAAQPQDARAVLEIVRAAIRKAIPKADEIISYRIPAYRLPEGVVIWFAGWKRHYSLYPATHAVVSALMLELAPYQVEKGTIRFPLGKPVPVTLIGKIARLRVKEVEAKPKPAARKKRPA